MNCCIGQTPFTLHLHSKLPSDRIGGAWRFRVAPGYKPPNDCHEIWSDTKRCNSTISSFHSRLFVTKHGGSETVNVSLNLPFCVPWMSLHGARPHGRLVRPDVVTDEIVSKQTNKQTDSYQILKRVASRESNQETAAEAGSAWGWTWNRDWLSSDGGR